VNTGPATSDQVFTERVNALVSERRARPQRTSSPLSEVHSRTRFRDASFLVETRRLEQTRARMSKMPSGIGPMDAPLRERSVRLSLAGVSASARRTRSRL
jgi:hypothetical protein